MRYHDTTIAGRWQRRVFTGLIASLFLPLAGLPVCQAQMHYSGGFFARRHPRAKDSSQQTAPKTTASAPKTPFSYFPDNDAFYPSYTPAGEPKRPSPSAADVLPYRIPLADLPWNRADFEDYNESLSVPQDSLLRQPKKYALTMAPLFPTSPADKFEQALLIAHLPEHAVLWVEGSRTASKGRTRYFQSPPLLAGLKYNYRLSAAWIEDGHWVSQTRIIPVQAGMAQAIYLGPN